MNDTSTIGPVKAIRLRCLDCSETAADVRDCEAKDCQLYRFRMGRRPKGSSPLKAIRAYCLWCCDGSAAEAKVCHPLDCMLRRFRFGKNPARTGKGNHEATSPGNRELSPVAATV